MENKDMGLLQLASRKDSHLKRKIFHIFPGLIGVSVYLLGLFSLNSIGYFAIACAAIFFLIEFFRLRNPKFNKFVCQWAHPFMRADEISKLSGAPFYALGVGLSCLFFEENIAFLSILFLIFGDPLAAFVGSVYGREYFLPGKTLEGTLACFLVCYGISFFYLKAIGVIGIDAVTFSLLAGLIGAVSELVSTMKIDDNLTIPLVSGVGISILNSLIPLL